VEWAIPPVVLNVFTIDAYAVPATVAYRQVAFSSVAKLKFVITAASTPVGCPLERTGGMVRTGGGEALSEPPENVRILAVDADAYTAIPGCPVVYIVPLAV
jgi:hypothetical protein